MIDGKSDARLTYVLTRKPIQRSTNPVDSDQIANLAHMEHLVGTLIKYNSVNSYEPHIAESWVVSDDHLLWKFNIRSGLKCEDGSSIDAKTFVEGLILAIRNHAFDESVPLFSNLKGWGDFILRREKGISGLRAVGDSVVHFQFEKRPTWVLEYLAMPYFGHYCRANFNDDGSWKSNSKIVSSGDYRLSGWDNEKNIVSLEPRKEFKGGFDLSLSPAVDVVFDELHSALTKNRTIISADVSEDFSEPNGWSVVQGTQSLGYYAILNHRREVFSDLKRRIAFSQLLKLKLWELRSSFSRNILSFNFFPETFVGSEGVGPEEVGSLGAFHGGEISVQLLPSHRYRTGYILEVLKGLAKEFNFRIVEKQMPTTGGMESRVKHREEEADIYFIGVDKGTNADPGVVRMMFCSKLGVRFPDVSGEICKLTDEYEEDLLSMTEAEYQKKFEHLLSRDASVIPIFHYGQFWLASPDVDVSALSPTMGLPRFDQVRLK